MYNWIVVFLIIMICIFILCTYLESIQAIENFENSLHYNNLLSIMPRVSQRRLDKYDQYKDKFFSEYFEIDRMINLTPSIKKCYAVSLFAQHVWNTHPNQNGSIDMSESGHWYQRYMTPFIRDLKQISPGWKVRIYLEPQIFLWFDKLLDREVPEKKNIEIFVMKLNSIGAQPGMMWRYLAMSDKSLDICHIADIDKPGNGGHSVAMKNDRYPLFKQFNQHKHIALATYHQPTRIARNWKLMDYTKTDINYPELLVLTPLVSSDVVIRPENIHFDVKHTMLCFINMMSVALEQNLFVCRKQKMDGNNPYFLKTKYGPCGYGTHYHTYGFDEFYLRSFVFYELALKSSILFIDYFGHSDLDHRLKTYLDKHNNITSS